MFYKYGGKQLYYFNTFDGQGEMDVGFNTMDKNEEIPTGSLIDDEECDSCAI
jgi:hypothetical protein